MSISTSDFVPREFGYLDTDGNLHVMSRYKRFNNPPKGIKFNTALCPIPCYPANFFEKATLLPSLILQMCCCHLQKKLYPL